MSTFGSPGGQQKLQAPKPPERGSFPLDHDGECKHIMTTYLACLKRTKGYNQEECRLISKNYLECRMERGLMARDSMANLGYAESQLERARQGRGMDGALGHGEGIGKSAGVGGIVDGAIGTAVTFGRQKKEGEQKRGWWG
ncbi:hypothetical protein FH972_022262 [Carpinus fangiana]|uniref:CHCH domain-containing protein n=1 Tax=Carpinus fangiana TaxID=176857 RepID=A0A5N6KSA5_9ROSI|nr:hypothetical protein FH972_022262 [Carpinus fangiana]